MVKIQIMSDLHLEYLPEYKTFELEPTAPYLALLGNIGNVQDDGFITFIMKALTMYKIVFLVPGNHEPYISSWCMTHDKLSKFEHMYNKGGGWWPQKEVEPRHGKLVVLRQTRYDLTSEITILGCILFSSIGPGKPKPDSHEFNDCLFIKNWSTEEHKECHASDVEWLNSEVQKIAKEEPNRKVIIFTHYCPTFQVAHEAFKDAGKKVSPATDLSDQICWKHLCVRAWAFGHTHFNCETVADYKPDMKVVTNQRGHYKSRIENFDPRKTLTIE